MSKLFVEIDVAGSVKGSRSVERNALEIGQLVLSAFDDSADPRTTVRIRCIDDFEKLNRAHLTSEITQ